MVQKRSKIRLCGAEGETDGIDEVSSVKVVLEFVWEWITGEGSNLMGDCGVEWLNRVGEGQRKHVE